jgi:sugar phosphate isomerase/epimerase
MKVGLYTVTYTAHFYEGEPLSFEEMFAIAADIGYDGIEVGARRPHAAPMDLDVEQRKAIKALGPRYGLEIPCVASYSNFGTPVEEYREAQLLMIRETIRLAHDLEAPIVRIFAGWQGITVRNGNAVYEMARRYDYHDVTALEQWHLAREGIVEASRWAEKYGVTLALQNHGPIINTYRQTLEMIREVNSPWVKACIDTPLLTSQEDDYVYNAAIETGDLQVWSHSGGWKELPNGLMEEGTDKGIKIVNYPAFFKGLQDIGYDGYVAYEGCGPALVNHDLKGVEEATRRARLAHDYLRRQIAAVSMEEEPA